MASNQKLLFFIIVVSLTIDICTSKKLFFKDFHPSNMNEEGHYVFDMDEFAKTMLKGSVLDAKNEDIAQFVGNIFKDIKDENADFQDHRSKRAALLPTNSSKTSENVTAVVLNDPLRQMIIHWAGKNSSAIVVLTKNVGVEEVATKSNVYFSLDYGKSYQKKPAVATPVSKFYHTPSDINRYIFTDVAGQKIYTTTNMGKTFQPTSCPFKPTFLGIHPVRSTHIIGYDKENATRPLWLSQDFGQTWRKIQSDVIKAYWGYSTESDFDHMDALYVERPEPSGKLSVLKSETFFLRDLKEQILISKVDEFVIRNNSLFAVRSKEKGDDNDLLFTLTRHSQFVVANFPTKIPKREFFIIDVAENQIMVLVSHGFGRTDLYISEPNKVDFIFSLANVTYYNPKGVGSTQGLLLNQNDRFADIHKVEGLRSIFIANTATINALTKQYNMSNMKTVITFDKGIIWEDVPPPRSDSKGKTICNSTICSLHLLQEFHHTHFSSMSSLMMSRSSAPGYILAAGNVGDRINNKIDLFFSSNGGKDWKEIKKGEWFYTWADHGGVIAIVQKYGKTNELFYSVNEGSSWNNVTFYSESINVYGLMTEPGETTTIFTVFGATNDESNSWIVIQVDLRGAFGRQCYSWQYSYWSPQDEHGMSCLLGTKVIFKRRYNPLFYSYSSLPCFNGKDYDRPTSEVHCHCTRFDFECSEGYYLAPNSHSLACILDSNSNTDPHLIPPNCRSGTTYKRTRGYQKVPGDQCTGGDADSHYGPVDANCPLIDEDAFLLITSTSGISRLNLENNKLENLPVSVDFPANIKEIDFDYSTKCIYFSAANKIKRLCLDGSLSYNKTIVSESLAISAMAFDWDSRNLYWSISSSPKIKVMNIDSSLQYTRTFALNSTIAHDIISMAVSPEHGYLYYSNRGDYHGTTIIRMTLNGKNATEIFYDYGSYVRTSLTVDAATNRLYFIAKGSYSSKIASLDLDESYVHRTVRYDSKAKYVAVFKHYVYYWHETGDLQRSDKFESIGNTTIAVNLQNVGVIKVVRKGLQAYPNKCGNGTSGCHQICVPVPSTDKANAVVDKCICDDNHNRDSNSCKCRSGELATAEGQCEPNATNCYEGQFRCNNGLCIPNAWKCDHANDCPSGEDEMNCAYTNCQENYKQCPGTTHCIRKEYFCDKEIDCDNGADEKDCDFKCDDNSEFTCKSGQCINKNLTCDFNYDCNDGSDESNCTNPTKGCTDDEITCHTFLSFNDCVPRSWLCDGERDCLDGSDEKGCNASIKCPSYKFSCGNGECVFQYHKCDGSKDCTNGADEDPNTCKTTPAPSTSTTPTFHSGNCSGSEMKCHSDNVCIPLSWKCDGVNDCGDHSDEFDCGRPANGTGISQKCTDSFLQYRCNHGGCILKFFECDGDNDCGDWSDEKHCANFHNKVHNPGCFTGNGFYYDGTRNYTKSGRICQRWGSDVPHDPHYWPQDRDNNYCRNPDNDGYGPWCYTMDPDKRWEYCGIPRCGSGGVPPSRPPPTVTPKVCSDGYFDCGNSKCVHEQWTCDGDNDCPDGLDEKFCNFTCHTKNEFQCKNGHCIVISAKCNGVDDCNDNSDEEEVCPTIPIPSSCQHNEFRCTDSKECIPKAKKCDGHPDCRDYSDEHVNCSRTYTTAEPLYTCKDSSGSFSSASTCDFVPDCRDFTDELNCPGHIIVGSIDTNAASCPKDSKKACMKVSWSSLMSQMSTNIKDKLRYVIQYHPRNRDRNKNETLHTKVNETSAMLTELEWNTPYEVHFTVSYNGIVLPPQFSPTLQFRTPHGTPTTPTGLKAHVSYITPMFLVDLEWDLESLNLNDLTGFFFRAVYKSGAPTVFVRSYYSPDDPNPNHKQLKLASGTVNISVMATNEIQNSSWSKSILVVLSTTGKPTMLKSAPEGYSCNVSWSLPRPILKDEVVGYLVRVTSDAIDREDIFVNGSGVKHTTIQKLQPQTTFMISVAIVRKPQYSDAIQGPFSDEVSCYTAYTDPIFPNITLIKENTTKSVNVLFSPSQDNYVYEVSYGVSLQTMSKSTKVEKSPAYIDGLPVNTLQLFRVRVVEPYIGQYSSIKKARPLFDYTEKVRDLHVESDDPTVANIIWRRPTDAAIAGLAYVVTVTHGSGKVIANRKTAPTTNGTVTLVIDNLMPDTTYDVTVRVDHTGSIPATYTYVTGKVPGPSQLRFESEGEHTGKYKVAYQIPENYNHIYASESITKLEIYVCPGWNVPTVNKTCTSFPDIPGSSRSTSIMIENPGKYTVFMRAVCPSALDCQSSSIEVFAEDTPLIHPGPSQVTLSKTSVIAIAVPVAIILVVLLAAVVYLQVRRRRLADAYRGFVASHYDPQSGEAIFVSSNDDDDNALDDDQDAETPLITGFADDEPLIVA